MCSIVGIGLSKGHTIKDKEALIDTFNNIMLKADSRGGSACGVAVCSPGHVHLYKDKVRAGSFLNLQGTKDVLNNISLFGDDPTCVILGHCRLRTKGTQDKPVNNHPIVSGNIIGIHNGHISNDESLWVQYSTLLSRRGEVDSEVIFALIDHYQATGFSSQNAVKKAANDLVGGYACAYIDRRKPHILNLFKNGNPIDVAEFENTGVVMFASDRRFIEDAVGNRFGVARYRTLERHKYLGINLKSKSFLLKDIDK